MRNLLKNNLWRGGGVKGLKINSWSVCWELEKSVWFSKEEESSRTLECYWKPEKTFGGFLEDTFIFGKNFKNMFECLVLNCIAVHVYLYRPRPIVYYFLSRIFRGGGVEWCPASAGRFELGGFDWGGFDVGKFDCLI